MTPSDELRQVNTIFIDTAPIIYFIEANPQFGSLAKEVVDSFQTERVSAFTSVITLTEVLSKPLENKDEELAGKFAEFLEHGKNLGLVEISASVAKNAGKLRGHYPHLRTIDAIHISAASEAAADVFVTNDRSLKQIGEIKVLILSDYLEQGTYH